MKEIKLLPPQPRIPRVCRLRGQCGGGPDSAGLCGVGDWRPVGSGGLQAGFRDGSAMADFQSPESLSGRSGARFALRRDRFEFSANGERPRKSARITLTFLFASAQPGVGLFWGRTGARSSAPAGHPKPMRCSWSVHFKGRARASFETLRLLGARPSAIAWTMRGER